MNKLDKLKTLTELGPRPSPDQISFDPSCFVTIGKEKVWTVLNPIGWGQPKEFKNQEEAEQVAKKLNNVVIEGEREIKKRIKWTLDKDGK